jgi:EAL domain-containing protein (putative c-di-GMP-specific phosphodiesterase class I)
LALFTRVQHVRHHLANLVREQPELVQAGPHALLVRGSLVPLLRRLSATLTYTQRQAARAAPWDGAEIDYARGASLDVWADRLDTPWFAAAAAALHFVLQPIVALADGEVHGYEALVRARLGGRELSAGALLQAAEAHEQTAAFDARARSQAIRQGYPRVPAPARLFVNFSPTVVYDPDICLGATFRAAAEAGADVRRLVFEVTEAHAFPDLALLRRILDRYRAEGAAVALDDMGSGHTSLLYLDALRPDYVKLDRGLVSGLRPGDPRVPLIGAMIRYAHDLGVRVIAEGIETLAELRIVHELGADLAQGYYLGRPAAEPAGPACLDDFASPAPRAHRAYSSAPGVPPSSAPIAISTFKYV